MFWQKGDKTSFRPLSRGLSFNDYEEVYNPNVDNMVFVPFLGDFLSIKWKTIFVDAMATVFVPFLGDFFQYDDVFGYQERYAE